MRKDVSPDSDYADPKGCLARIVWMMLGNVALFALILSIARVPPWTPTWLDIAFWGIVGASILARYVDVARLDGQTVNGAPATMAHVRRYAAALAAVALSGWAVAHSVEV